MDIKKIDDQKFSFTPDAEDISVDDLVNQISGLHEDNLKDMANIQRLQNLINGRNSRIATIKGLIEQASAIGVQKATDSLPDVAEKGLPVVGIEEIK